MISCPEVRNGVHHYQAPTRMNQFSVTFAEGSAKKTIVYYQTRRMYNRIYPEGQREGVSSSDVILSPIESFNVTRGHLENQEKWVKVVLNGGDGANYLLRTNDWCLDFNKLCNKLVFNLHKNREIILNLKLLPH